MRDVRWMRWGARGERRGERVREGSRRAVGARRLQLLHRGKPALHKEGRKRLQNTKKILSLVAYLTFGAPTQCSSSKIKSLPSSMAFCAPLMKQC